jgi:hypothetical protein
MLLSYLFYTRGRIRTDPGTILSRLSLPLDYTGKVLLAWIEHASGEL